MTLALSAELLVLGGVCAGPEEARAAAEQALDGGAAAERFGAMVAALGGPSDLIENPDVHLRAAPVVRAVEPAHTGTVVRVDVRAVGLAVVDLGGGRARETDPVDHSVGFTEVAALGEPVGPGDRRWRWCTRATRRRPSGPQARCGTPSRSARTRAPGPRPS